MERFNLFDSGLRGAIAFALAINLDGFEEDKRRLLVTTTLVIVLFTLLVLGGSTLPLLKVSQNMRVAQRQLPPHYL